VIHALDEVFSELRALEIKYMLKPDSSNGPAMKVPLLVTSPEIQMQRKRGSEGKPWRAARAQ